MAELLCFLAGLFIGGVVGFFAFALAAVAAQSDRELQHLDD